MLRDLLPTLEYKVDELYRFLPVSTSYQQELRKSAQDLLKDRKIDLNLKRKWNQFIGNEDPINIQNELILLKLKGFIDQKDITGKSTEIKKLPSKVQVGTMIEGDPFQSVKIRKQKKSHSVVDYFLNKDKNADFSTRKFTQIQKVKHRKKKITKKSIKSRTKK